jgi:cyclic pyranopterin phosphate synthase
VPGLDLRLTTNGTLLAGKIRTLKELGVSCLNISLDTLDPAKFAGLTGMEAFGLTRQAIDDCLEEGLRVKVNAVALKGVNDTELADFLRLARDYPLDVRFIEFMPIGGGTRWKDEYYWPAEQILESAMALADLEPVGQAGQSSGPARLYTISGGKGRLGLISPLSDHFCKTCNRLRVTSDGRLRTCLFSDKEYRLRPALRKLGPDAVRTIIERAGNLKPIGYELLRQARDRAAVCGKVMSAIGG